MRLRTDYFPGFTHHPLAAPGTGMLVSADGTYAAPVVDGFVFFNEADLPVEALIAERCARLAGQLRDSRPDYERFVRAKGRRPNYDIYACFQPFNEAFKAFFPFFPALRRQLPAGAVILNLWDRTGYTAALLAGLFPEQRVINVWEGDKDTLGYKGFDFWYQPTDGRVQIAFADLDQPLPFATDSIHLVVGLDTLHRFDQARFLRELLRIVHPEGTLLFPHVHLTNSEPEPFFERGCRQLHGRDYDALFRQITASTGRRGYLLPEPEMFVYNELGESVSKPVYSAPDSEHYNTSAAILSDGWAEQHQLQPFRFDDLEEVEDCRVLLNPLLEVDLGQQRVWYNPERLAGRVGYLLERHPVYLRKLAREERLTDAEVKILYWAGRLLTVAEITTRSGVPAAEVLASLKQLQSGDVLQVVPLTEQQLRLQSFVSTQEYLLPAAEQTVAALWQRAVAHFADRVFLHAVAEETEINYGEAADLMAMIRAALHDQGVGPGMRVVHVAAKHFEGVLALLAIMEMGAVAVPVDHEAAPAFVRGVLELTEPVLVLSDQSHLSWLRETAYPVVQFDAGEETSGVPVFADWLEAAPEASFSDPAPQPDTLACLLFTSGSTGAPKGVELTHGQLVRSARLVTENFAWATDDRFFSPGHFDSMSGLRNHCLAPLEVGASVILPPAEAGAHLFALTETMERYRATVLGTTPALLGQLVQHAQRVRPGLRALRTVICTGSHLPPALRQNFAATFGLPPLNYYGLTETTGICATETADDHRPEASTIGRPCGVIAQVVDEAGTPLPAGEEGHLRLYGENITRGYYRNPKRTAELLRDGWLYTGDTARYEADGHLSLLGRSRDIIKLPSGQLVFASAVENVLVEAGELVAAAAVTSVERNGLERMVAFVVPTAENTTAIERTLTERLTERLGHRLVPARWVFVDRLPVGSTGKVLKRQLLAENPDHA